MPDKTRTQNQQDTEILADLSPASSVLVVLRSLYGLMLDYAAYIPDGGGSLILSKDQLVFLVDRGLGEMAMKDLPGIVQGGMVRPIDADSLDEPENLRALVLETRGARTASVARAANPDEPDYPEWWEAPIPFAICTRTKMRLNPAALSVFGSDLERLNVAALPDKEEFIVELEGRGRPCFLAFRRLEPHIFTIDDCTGDLVEAQDISWWAAVGRAWTAQIEAQGRTWKREENIPAGFTGQSWPCEWQGRFLGYLCVTDAPASKKKEKETETEKETNIEAGAGAETGEEQKKEKEIIKDEKGKREIKEGAPKPRKETQAEGRPPAGKRLRRAPVKAVSQTAPSRKEDEVLEAIGPQTMGLLAAGQLRDPEPPVRSGNAQGKPDGRRREIKR